MSEKTCCKNNKRTTSAEDTQNQRYQRVLNLLLVLRFTGMVGVYKPPRPGLPPHTETRTSISK